jgi:NADPH-dependent 2,4-dienoyl-CoA reductase/sulfur reductase-like enzyme
MAALDDKAKAILAKYEQERLKRVRSDGLKQFITTSDSTRYHEFGTDIWVDDSIPDPGVNCITDGGHYEALILGAGYGGLLAAARLIEAGMDVNQIRLIDTAGGFGGTWWFNR